MKGKRDMCGWNKLKKQIAAFTLMEVIVAIMIGSILVPSLVIVLGQTSKKGSETLSAYRDAAITDSILRRKVEELMSISYTDSSLNIASAIPFQAQEQDFTGICTVSYVNENLAEAQTDTGYKKISLRVTTPRGKDYVLNAYVTAWK